MSDTIAAIATPQLPSAIGILRLSGPGTLTALDRVFRARNGRAAGEQTPRRMVYGDLLDADGSVIDNVLCVRFPGPDSYTGEDCAELHCHGSPVVLNAGLAALFATGCRQAKGGEFTRRAFLNGRMDLIQAESVADLIDAETAEAAKNAVCQLDGALSRAIGRIYDGLMDMAARFYAVVDYPDEDIEDVQRQQMLDTLRTSQQELEALLATFSRGQLLKLGVPAVILGRPNAGKSSLLNALLGYDRAIVTDIAGTTRDTVEEKVLVGGVLLRLTDTAGQRETDDPVERIGVERARSAAQSAELVIAVLDGSAPLEAGDRAILDEAAAAQRSIVLLNKSDLPAAFELPGALRISARTGEGLDALEARVAELFPPEKGVSAGEVLTSARQADAVSRALDYLRETLAAMDEGFAPDAVLTELEGALGALGELSGRSVREDVTNGIFARFCVGK